MTNRRFAVHEIRNVIVRMRLGETDRQIARAKVVEFSSGYTVIMIRPI